MRVNVVFEDDGRGKEMRVFVKHDECSGYFGVKPDALIVQLFSLMYNGVAVKLMEADQQPTCVRNSDGSQTVTPGRIEMGGVPLIGGK